MISAICDLIRLERSVFERQGWVGDFFRGRGKGKGFGVDGGWDPEVWGERVGEKEEKEV